MIHVTYKAIDGYRERRTFKTLKGARRYATHWVGPHPEVGVAGAVSGDGVGLIQVDGDARSATLFPPEAETLVEALQREIYRLWHEVGRPDTDQWRAWPTALAAVVAKREEVK